MKSIISIVLLFVFCGTGFDAIAAVIKKPLGPNAVITLVHDRPTIFNTPPVNFNSSGVYLRDVQFYLYTRKNPNTFQTLSFKNARTLRQSYFNVKLPLKFVIHGWKNNHSSPACVLVRQAFLKRGNYNVIVVDWGKISMRHYLYAAKRIRAVSGLIGLMLEFLVKQGSDPRKISVVGHSLGAHIAGLSALQSNSNISHVVGLDPAAPGFITEGPSSRISSEDAKYVEVIHTCSDKLGLFRPLGHADFYPNVGGPNQPGCGIDPTGSCAHARAYMYYAESLTNPKDLVCYQVQHVYGFRELQVQG